MLFQFNLVSLPFGVGGPSDMDKNTATLQQALLVAGAVRSFQLVRGRPSCQTHGAGWCWVERFALPFGHFWTSCLAHLGTWYVQLLQQNWSMSNWQAKSVAVPIQSSAFVFERLTFASQSLASAKLKGRSQFKNVTLSIWNWGAWTATIERQHTRTGCFEGSTCRVLRSSLRGWQFSQAAGGMRTQSDTRWINISHNYHQLHATSCTDIIYIYI